MDGNVILLEDGAFSGRNDRQDMTKIIQTRPRGAEIKQSDRKRRI